MSLPQRNGAMAFNQRDIYPNFVGTLSTSEMGQTTDENDEVLAPVDQAGKVVTKQGVAHTAIGFVALIAALLIIGAGGIGEVI